MNRGIDFVPGTVAYDPRHMLQGYHDHNSRFHTGFFDKGSFTETLGGWARTVVTGRARLGGIPVGVIAVETRTVDLVIPADPANPESKEELIKQPGQVWFPDSAFKTAQAIKDFSHGENLPLIIFANWRGFSGGQNDMFKEVLKFGSYIVDNLRVYKQPVFVYLPPHAELRGGSWVVVDPTINSDYMELYADSNARGGVLEPSGTISIKFRESERIDAMKRIEPQLSTDKKRMAELMPVYEQVATQFADLHDTPGRMKAKGVISEIIDWNVSREFFYWRLRRRLHEERITKAVMEADSTMTLAGAREALVRITEMGGLPARIAYEAAEAVDTVSGDRERLKGMQACLSNRVAVGWLEEMEDHIAEHVEAIRKKAKTELFRQAAMKDAGVVVAALAEAVKGMSQAERAKFLRTMRANGF